MGSVTYCVNRLVLSEVFGLASKLLLEVGYFLLGGMLYLDNADQFLLLEPPDSDLLVGSPRDDLLAHGTFGRMQP